MLVPVHGDKNQVNALNLNKRNRTMPTMAAALKTVPSPPIYIFNVWIRPWGERPYRIPGCKPGKPYSKPLVIDALVLAEYDLGDGGGNMGTTVDPGMEVARSLIGIQSAPLLKVLKHDEDDENAEDVIEEITDELIGGIPGGLFTTDKSWFGVFATMNEVPKQDELELANRKLKQMMQLIYDTGSELLQAGEKVDMLNRRNYNDAAKFLGRAPLWGNQEHTMDRCVYCKEPIVAGARKCRHCGSRLDSKEAKALMRGDQPEEAVNAD
jgi:hypothetical protein